MSRRSSGHLLTKKLRVLSWILLSILILGLPGLATASSPDWNDLLRRAEHPGTPGTGPLPTSWEIHEARQQLFEEKAATEEYLRRNSKDVQDCGQRINAYFNHLSLLISVRIAMNLPYSTQWQTALSLDVPAELLARLPGLAAPQTSRSGDRYFNLVVSARRAGVLALRLSQSHVQGLEIAHLAQNPDQENYLTLVQFLVTRQLLKNYASIQALRSSPSANDPEVSPALVAKMQSLGLSGELQEEQRRVDLEERARYALEASLTQTRLPGFVNPGECRAVAEVFGQSVRLEQAVCAALRESEKRDFATALRQEFESSPILFSAPIPLSAKLGSLRDIVANAKASTQLMALSKIQAALGAEWGQREKGRLFSAVDANRVRYLSLLGMRILQPQLEAARASVAENSHFPQQRRNFVAALVASAREISRKTRAARAGSVIDPGALVRSFGTDLQKLDADSEVRNLVFQLSRDPDFATASARLKQKLIDLTSPSIGDPDPGKVIDYLKSADFTPKLHFERSPRFGRVLARQMAADHKEEVLQILEIGEWMGLLGPNPAPSVADIFPAQVPLLEKWILHFKSDLNPTLDQIVQVQEDQQTYYNALSEELLNRYPILGMKVNGDEPLYDTLTREPQNADIWVERALRLQGRQIEQQLQAVGEAQSLNALQGVVTQSMLLQNALSDYPEFQRAERNFETGLVSPDFLQQALRKYVNPSVGWGFTALLLMQGTKFLFKDASPWIDAALTGMSPLIQTFTRYAVISMIADTAYQLGQVRRSRDVRNQITALNGTSTSEGNFFDAGDVSESNSAYHMAVGMFIGRVALDGLLMYRPMIIELGKELASNVSAEDIAGDVDAFRKLDLRPGDWESVQPRLEVLRHTSAASDPETWNGYQEAADRLLIRVRSGEIWHPRYTPAFRNLISLLSPDERLAS